jgi:hypothetical protein
MDAANYVLQWRPVTQFEGSQITDVILAGEVFRVFTQYDSDETAAAFANRQKHMGVSYGMVVVHTGTTAEDADGQDMYELDFGVGHRYAQSDTGSGLGGYYTVEMMRKLGFRQLVSDAQYVLARPSRVNSEMWGSKTTCRFRLRPEWARLNCYCILLFKRYLAEDQESYLEMAMPSLLCKYSECWSLGQFEDGDMHTDALLKQRLFNSLAWGRSLLPDSFVHVAISALDAQRGRDAEHLGQEDTDYIAYTARGSNVAVSQNGNLLIDTCAAKSHALGVFPNMCSHKLTNVYSNLKYRTLGPETDLRYNICTLDVGKYALYWDENSWATHRGALGTALVDTLAWLPMQYPSTIDFITKYARDEGTNHGYWSVVGTRVHRKCYLHAMYLSSYKYDTRLLEIYTETSGTDTDAVCLQNECVSASGTMDHTIVADMYERVFAWDRTAPGCPDAVLLEDFTVNMMAVARCAVESTYRDVRVLSAEYPVYWPFGLFSKTSSQIGRAYETRIDLLLSGTTIADTTDQRKLLIVAYKTRMEISTHGSKVYELTNPNDRLQLRLNTWMLYFNTGVVPEMSYVVQASRRGTPASIDDVTTVPMAGGVCGCVARLSLLPVSVQMLKLISRFAIHPYGNASVARYCDEHFIVPDMTALLKGLGMGTGDHLEYNVVVGTHAIFTDILSCSSFNRKISKLIDGSNDENVNSFYLPDDCVTGTTGGVSACVAECVVGRSGTIEERWLQLQQNWRQYPQLALDDDDVTLSAVYAAYRYGAIGVPDSSNFVPVLFDNAAEFRPLLYCNATAALQLRRGDEHNRLIAASPTNGLMLAMPNERGIFRASLGRPILKYRLSQEPDIDSHDPTIRAIAAECARHRKTLNTRVHDAADRINQTLSTRINAAGFLDGIDAIEFQSFWQATTQVYLSTQESRLMVRAKCTEMCTQ